MKGWKRSRCSPGANEGRIDLDGLEQTNEPRLLDEHLPEVVAHRWRVHEDVGAVAIEGAQFDTIGAVGACDAGGGDADVRHPAGDATARFNGAAGHEATAAIDRLCRLAAGGGSDVGGIETELRPLLAQRRKAR